METPFELEARTPDEKRIKAEIEQMIVEIKKMQAETNANQRETARMQDETRAILDDLLQRTGLKGLF